MSDSVSDKWVLRIATPKRPFDIHHVDEQGKEITPPDALKGDKGKQRLR